MNTPMKSAKSLAPQLAFARMSDPPDSETIKFYDGYFSALGAGSYTIEVTHTVSAPSGKPPVPPYTMIPQQIIVDGPQFTIDPNAVQSQFPPIGGTDQYEQQLPFLVLGDPSLPWERPLVPGDPTPNNPTPWLALVIFAEGEITVNPETNTPVSTTTVQQFLAPDSNIFKPDLTVSPDVLASNCQTITISAATFTAVMPQQADLKYLAHCRAVNAPDEDLGLVAVVLANRLPVASGSAVRYYAQVVSLEGFADYLPGPNSKPIPPKTAPPPGTSAQKDVQMVSHFGWSFVSLPETGVGFDQLVEGLIASQEPNPDFELPVPTGAIGLPPAAFDRLTQGYVPLSFITGMGEKGQNTFAWYRGPFSPVVPQPLPAVSNPAVPVVQAASADALMIYLAEQGLFDLSYAAAWQIGRALALADASFSQAVRGYRLAARTATARLAQRIAMPHFAGESDLRSLLAPGATRRHFGHLVADHAAENWTHALAIGRGGGRESSTRLSSAPAQREPRAAMSPHSLLTIDNAVSALGDHLSPVMDPVAAWIANLRLLTLVPFSHLVPDPRLLPPESIRFFYVDPNWLDALQAGAMSLAIQTSVDVALHTAFAPHLAQAIATHSAKLFAQSSAMRGVARAASPGVSPGTLVAGMLIRSQIVADWPALTIAATAQSTVSIVRNDCPAPSVRLCLFDAVPDRVTLGEPYQSLGFGIQSKGVFLRNVTGASSIGKQTGHTFPTGGAGAFMNTYCRSVSSGVLKVEPLADALAQKLQASTDFGAGDFALQMVRLPELQSFPSSHTAATE